MRCQRTVTSMLLLLSACGGNGTTASDAEWETFKAQSTRYVDGREIYVVEWDLPVSSLEELRRYYDERFSVGTSRSPLMVNQVSGEDDLWDSETALNLTYCVSTGFGGDYTRAVNEMQAAAADWALLANVRFVYDASEDGNCDGTNPNVTFAVEPWSGGGACAFFPSGGGCVPRTVVMNFDDFDDDPNWDTIAPNLTTTGVFRHELGHVLGFRHEHTNPASGTCFEDSNWRSVTPYDQSSVMHYQWCNGVTTADLSLTELDQQGSIELYGLAAALVDAAM